MSGKPKLFLVFSRMQPNFTEQRDANIKKNPHTCSSPITKKSKIKTVLSFFKRQHRYRIVHSIHITTLLRNFSNYSLYLPTAYPSIFYGEGFWATLPFPWERERILKVWFAFTFFVQASTSGNQNIIGRTSKHHPLPFKVSSNGGQSIIGWKELSRKILRN